MLYQGDLYNIIVWIVSTVTIRMKRWRPKTRTFHCSISLSPPRNPPCAESCLSIKCSILAAATLWKVSVLLIQSKAHSSKTDKAVICLIPQPSGPLTKNTDHKSNWFPFCLSSGSIHVSFLSVCVAECAGRLPSNSPRLFQHLVAFWCSS